MESELKFLDVVRYLWRWQDWEIDQISNQDVVKHKYSTMFFFCAGGVCLRESKKLNLMYETKFPFFIISLTDRIEKKLKNRITINA